MFPKCRKFMYNGFVEVLMRTEVESLTPAETAVVSGVSVRDVHRIIDEQILPDSFYNVTQSRSFKSQACVYISFYFRAADRLTAEERQRTIARLPSFGMMNDSDEELTLRGWIEIPYFALMS